MQSTQWHHQARGAPIYITRPDLLVCLRSNGKIPSPSSFPIRSAPLFASGFRVRKMTRRPGNPSPSLKVSKRACMVNDAETKFSRVWIQPAGCTKGGGKPCDRSYPKMMHSARTFHDEQTRVQADVIRKVERPHRMPRPELHGKVDVRDGRVPPLDEGHGLHEARDK